MPILAALAAGALIAQDLRCEALNDPLAIESSAPQLSWKLTAANAGKNLKQTGYRIIVASDPKILSRNRGDLWDSGRVNSGASFGIRYAGAKLASRQRCWWKVQVWDQGGQASQWSLPGFFAVGMQKPTDWKAKWIHGAKPSNEKDPLTDAAWIGKPEWKGDAPAGTYRFSRSFSMEPGPAKIFLTADNTFIARLNGKEIARTTDVEGWRKVQVIDITGQFVPGANQIEIEVTNATASPCGLIAAIRVGGKTITTDVSWICDDKPAAILHKNGSGPWGRVGLNTIVKAPAQYFDRKVSLGKKVKRATAYVTALGLVDFSINGKRVSEDLFTPGWTNYKIRTHYRAFDVTKNLKVGENSFGAVLGQGWFAGYIAWGMQRDHYGDTPMLKAQVEIEFTDGTTQTIATDQSWQVSDGPITDEHFLHGEKHDARIQPSGWTKAKIGEFKTLVQAFPGNPVRPYQTLKAKSIKPLSGGRYLIDFGQNLSGFVKLRVKQKAGSEITFRHAERLDPAGEVYLTNLRAAQAIDRYTCAGGRIEEWSPRFTFHGFQYVEVSGLEKAPAEDTVQAIAISSATPESGTLVTSDSMLNKLVSNAWWTQKMNFIDVPTDCPQRDERLGWTGDAQAYVLTAAYYSDVQAFFTKWLESLDDDQRADGQYPKVAPVLAGLDDGGPAWSDAGVICPMTIYDMYGDRALLARHYPNMQRFIEFCRKRSKANLLPPDQFHCFGDWLSINANTPNEVIAQAYFALSVQLTARAASILGKKDDEKRLLDLHRGIVAAFQKEIVSPDGKVRGDTQCAYVLALAFDLLTPEQTKLASNHLVKNIESRGWRLSTGFVGTRDLMHVLSKIGRDDVAFRLLHNVEFPSWGFTIVNGATSIWERWDGWTPEKGFQDPGMNSFAHYAYGAVAGWMFKHIGGISELEPGYGKILVAPKLDPKLTWSKCRYDSVRGPILVEWKKSARGVSLKVEIPPNTTAEVRIPRHDGTFETKQVGSGVWDFQTMS